MEISESIINEFKELELMLLNINIRQNSEKLNNLLADDFTEFGKSGRIYDKQSVIKSLSNESFVNHSIIDFKVKQLSEDVFLITYKTIQNKTENHSGTDSLRSSIWKKYTDGWKIIFHQGTSIPKE